MDSEPVLNILLPCCLELQEDVFLEILKNAVWRSRMDDCYLDALKSGMTTKTLCVKSKDLLVDWKELSSKSQLLRQYQVLGYWTMHNYPALGKKLFGKTWKAVQRQSIEVVGSEPMSPEAVDAVIMRKMKIRSIELSVCKSTVSKLRYFVETPNNIVRYNEKRLYPKVKSFDIQDDYVKECWKALKYGNMVISKVESDSIGLVF